MILSPYVRGKKFKSIVFVFGDETSKLNLLSVQRGNFWFGWTKHV